MIRETRPHIADGLSNFASRVRKYWIVTTVFLHCRGPRRHRPGDYRRPSFVTWGVLAFVTSYIPNIGFILGVIPRSHRSARRRSGQRGRRRGRHTAINVVVQTIIQPRFTGDAVGISATVPLSR